MRSIPNSSLREEREKMEIRKIVIKIEGLFRKLKQEIRTIEPSTRYHGGFNPQAGGYGDRANIDLLGTSVAIIFKATRARSIFHPPTGNVRITIGDWTNKGEKTFNDRKGGHDLKEVAAFVVASAKRIIENDKKAIEQAALCEHLQFVAKKINEKHGVTEFHGSQPGAPKIIVHSDGRLRMDMPFELSEEHADRLLGFMKKELGL